MTELRSSEVARLKESGRVDVYEVSPETAIYSGPYGQIGSNIDGYSKSSFKFSVPRDVPPVRLLGHMSFWGQAFDTQQDEVVTNGQSIWLVKNSKVPGWLK
jgi:hypothetical protein